MTPVLAAWLLAGAAVISAVIVVLLASRSRRAAPRPIVYSAPPVAPAPAAIKPEAPAREVAPKKPILSAPRVLPEPPPPKARPATPSLAGEAARQRLIAALKDKDKT